jgi:flagellar FliL protein
MADQATLTRTATGSADGDEPKRGRKGRKKLVVVVLLVVLAGGGAVFLRGHSAPAAAPVPGAVLKLDPIYVNLTQGHYLKLGLALQETTTAGKDLDGSHALDAAISVFSGQNMADLTDTTTRNALKAHLVEQIRTLYAGQVMDLYLTEFVMQ